jgi:hypothetical protein
MSMEHWWNDTDRGKLKYLEENLSKCRIVHYKCDIDWPETEPGPPMRKAGDFQYCNRLSCLGVRTSQSMPRY